MKIAQDLAPSYVGTGATVGGSVVAFCTAIEPVLQVIVLLITAIVGIFTAVWTWKKIQKHDITEE